MSLTFAEQKQQIKEWGTKHGIADQVEEFNANMTKMKQEHRQNVTKLISELSSAQEKLSAIMDNENQTLIELHRAIRNLTAENPPLYHVLQFANFQLIRRPRAPHKAVTSERPSRYFGVRERAEGLFGRRRMLNELRRNVGFGASSLETSNSILDEEDGRRSVYKEKLFF
ncbi:hypothetical protein OESDEN_05563 [Oesophagostomum dentatum]|uniref:SXP/RAL-2 family protein Ani s 5-like cation-binding domain-containing protein n=1 Tax=Oesophagostomum dentatum TaxID=61180 RepID=A0A0B1TF99_OESDE|nr:hypothetical protein OESDEN_05563 [Oesophagostomum dentatum]